jgi:oligopeptidase B
MHNPDALEPDIRAYLDAENAYQDSIMCQTKPLQETLYSEMRGRIKEDDNSAPLRMGLIYMERSLLPMGNIHILSVSPKQVGMKSRY